MRLYEVHMKSSLTDEFVFVDDFFSFQLAKDACYELFLDGLHACVTTTGLVQYVVWVDDYEPPQELQTIEELQEQQEDYYRRHTL